MRFLLARKGEDIICIREFTNINDKGEITQMMAELQLTINELLKMFDEWEDEE